MRRKSWRGQSAIGHEPRIVAKSCSVHFVTVAGMHPLQSRNVTKYFYFVTLLKYKSLLFLSNEVHFLGSTFTCNEVQNMCTLSKCSEVLIISLLNLQMS